jgi:hypothetical protein
VTTPRTRTGFASAASTIGSARMSAIREKIASGSSATAAASSIKSPNQISIFRLLQQNGAL